MPGFNQTGPAGQGPMTGRRMGRCTNYGAKFKQQVQNNPEQSNNYDNTPFNQPAGQALGLGRGCRRGNMGRQGRMRGNW